VALTAVSGSEIVSQAGAVAACGTWRGWFTDGRVRKLRRRIHAGSGGGESTSPGSPAPAASVSSRDNAVEVLACKCTSGLKGSILARQLSDSIRIFVLDREVAFRSATAAKAFCFQRSTSWCLDSGCAGLLHDGYGKGPCNPKGIDQLMAYLRLVRDSFPGAVTEGENGQSMKIAGLFGLKEAFRCKL